MEFLELIKYLRELKSPKNHQIRIDSREVQTGDIFVAIPGANEDGAKYIPAAIAAGAGMVVCADKNFHSEEAVKNGVSIIYHENPRKALWQLAEAYYATTAACKLNNVRIIGITGTNGKTTSAYLLEHLFTQLGHKVGVMGTVSYRWPGHEQEAPLTTPDSLTIHATIAAMLNDGVDIIIMEVSSHALEQDRVGGLDFSGAIFSNLTQDHLDFHQDMDSYFAAKAKLFTTLPKQDKAIAINSDDAWGRKLLTLCPQALDYGLQEFENTSGNYVKARIISMSPAGLHLQMQWRDKAWELKSPLVGTFNALNLLGVQTLALGLGVEVESLVHLEDFYGVCGRLERVQNVKNLNVFVDYAHTPDALVNVLQALRGAGFKKIITVFGCGGNRDRTKRPLMGKAVAEHTDVAVLTSDNPRFENPQDIIADVLPGLQARAGLEIIVEPDRKEATKKALQILYGSDVVHTAVLIAGKGHENYQIIEGVKYPYSDQENLRELISAS